MKTKKESQKRRGLFEAIVIGSSAGGIKALITVLSALPQDFSLPIMIVQHIHPHSDSYLANLLSMKTGLRVKQADEKEKIKEKTVYIAPPNYHLLVEADKSFALTVDRPVNYSRPSVDVLFESAACVYGTRLIGIILTGANHDGSDGVKFIKKYGGYLIVQDPASAEVDSMPKASIAATTIDTILPLNDIGPFLLQLVNRSQR
jgi:two-component system chemotaxis response regulator CheB